MGRGGSSRFWKLPQALLSGVVPREPALPAQQLCWTLWAWGWDHRAPAPSSEPQELTKLRIPVSHLGQWVDALKLEKLLLQLLKLLWINKTFPSVPPPLERDSSFGLDCLARLSGGEAPAGPHLGCGQRCSPRPPPRTPAPGCQSSTWSSSRRFGNLKCLRCALRVWSETPRESPRDGDDPCCCPWGPGRRGRGLPTGTALVRLTLSVRG